MIKRRDFLTNAAALAVVGTAPLAWVSQRGAEELGWKAIDAAYAKMAAKMADDINRILYGDGPRLRWVEESEAKLAELTFSC